MWIWSVWQKIIIDINIWNHFIRNWWKVSWFQVTINTGPGTQGLRIQGPKDPRTGDLRTQSLEGCTATCSYNTTICQYLPMLQAQITAMSCMPSLCTQKALFIADTALLYQTQEHIIKKEGGRACNYIVLWNRQNLPPILKIEYWQPAEAFQSLLCMPIKPSCYRKRAS